MLKMMMMIMMIAIIISNTIYANSDIEVIDYAGIAAAYRRRPLFYKTMLLFNYLLLLNEC